MTKKYIVLQDGIKECGSACLLSIIKYYGGSISIDKILELTNTTKNGTNFYNLSIAGKELGLNSKGYKLENINELFQIDKPYISQLVIENYKHFVVVYKINNNNITIMDPAKGMIKMPIKEYEKIWTKNILIFTPYKPLPQYEDNNYILSIIKKIIIDNKNLIIKLISLSLITVFLTCIYSYYFKIIIDNIINTNKLNLLTITTIFIIILFLKLITEYLRNNLLLYLNEKLDLSIITSTIKKIIFLPFNYYKNKTTGEFISRINDLVCLKETITKMFIFLIIDIMLSIMTLIILFKINPSLTLILFIIIIMYLIITYIYRPITIKMTDTIQEDNSKVNSLLVQTINGYETIKGLSLENRQINKINKLYLKGIKDNIIFSRIHINQELLKDIFEKITIIFIIYLGTSQIMDKTFTIGSLITYNSLIIYFIEPFRNISDFYKDYYYAKNSIRRINNIISFKYDRLDKTNLNIYGNIVIKDLSFSYNQFNNNLENISIEINKNEKIVILGNSGSGKSTLLKLLYKYYQIPRNKIYLNGYDINDLKLLDIKDNIKYISQSEILFNDTIRNNIILDRDIKEEEFLEICNILEITDIIKDKDLSYDYELEENGANISGGQRQRIILARTLLSKSQIFLIDEGLNEIDIKLERIILKRIFEKYSDKIFIIVSHRLDNIDLYDKVIKLKDGKLTDVINQNERFI